MLEKKNSRLLFLRHTGHGERVRLAARAYDEEVVVYIERISGKDVSAIHNAVLDV